MPFTNLENIRNRLVDSEIAQAAYSDVPLQLSGISAVAVLHRNLVADSVVVKGKEIAAPQFAQKTLSSEPSFLGKPQLIPDSVAVASDTSLGTIYTENVDYQVDYKSGNVSRIATGGIPTNANVAIWFYAYTIFHAGADYYLNADDGTIRRAGGSDIEDGQVVFVDYQTLPANFSDGQIESAITEANDRLKQWVASKYHHSSDQALISAETYLTLAILLRIRAAATLQNNTMSKSATAARELLELAESYERQAVSLSAVYASPRSALSGPAGITARSVG